MSIVTNTRLVPDRQAVSDATAPHVPALGTVARFSSLGTSWIAQLRTHYSVPVHRLELVLTSVALSFLGGAAMFGFHALYRGEAGPQISNGSHWFLDSTLGFLALTPVLALLLAFAHRQVRRTWLRPVLVGVLFALVTAPGPLVHDLLVGGGTPLAHTAELVFGHQQTSTSTMAAHSSLSKVLGQLAVGTPVYILLTGLVTSVLHAMRASVTPLRGDLVPRPRPAW